MKEKIRDRRKNSSYPEIRVKRVQVNGFQLYFKFSQGTIFCTIFTMVSFFLHWTLLKFLVPYRWNREDYRFPRRLSFCPSVCLSVSPSVSPLSVRPLGFPNFSQSSFEILTWNLVYAFGYFMKEKIRDRRKNSSYPEIRVKRVQVNGFQLYF